MTRLRAYFSPAYAPADAALLQRLAVTAQRLQQRQLADLCAPAPVDPARLRGLHSDRYLDAFLGGLEPLASSQGVRWTPPIRDAALAMLGGQLEAVDHALQHGIAMNLACGFHHAVHERGSGFCPLNGLALVAHCLPHKRVLVLDCDEHGGNGTEEFAASTPNLYNISVFGTRFGCHGGERSWAFQVRVPEHGFDGYLATLHAAETLIRAHRPDIVLYQAGADCHRDDPKGTVGLDTRQLFQRDLFVFGMTRRLALPVMSVVAGGYQSASKVARLYVNTVRAANHVYFRSEGRDPAA